MNVSFLCQNNYVLDHIEREENRIFVIKIRKVSIAMPEFYKGKEFCLFHLLLYCLALEQSQVHDSLRYLLNENHFSLFKAYAEC